MYHGASLFSFLILFFSGATASRVEWSACMTPSVSRSIWGGGVRTSFTLPVVGAVARATGSFDMNSAVVLSDRQRL